jgi:hypothetical protein
MVQSLRLLLHGLFVLVCGSIGHVSLLAQEGGNGPKGANRDSAAEAKSAQPSELRPLIRSAKSGSWSAADTWEGGKLPANACRVQVRTGHTVVYDLKSEQVIRSIHVAGTLRFAPERDTRLDVGLIKIQPGDDASENGFDCDAHMAPPDPGLPRPALEVGASDRPVDAGHLALIRLTYVDGMDKESCPAIVCCGGRMDFHGAPMSRTWVKLGATVKKGDTALTLAEPVSGWRVGDRIIITTSRQVPGGLARVPRSGVAVASEKIITGIDGTKLTLDGALEEDHPVEGEFRPEAANLSRNVVVESANPKLARGHTMYHRNSAGAISYAEFRGLGKEGVLGRYSIHYHLVGDTMRGSFVLGASIWDSGNRWITIHGTNYLVVRDCVGYLSQGHGYYLEDGTEVFNVLDRNLAVQASGGKRLPNQALPFDRNEAAGFWWANCLNTFTRNVATGNERYAYRFEMRKTAAFDPNLPVQQPDGSMRRVDVRTLPFVRFEDNECHDDRHYGVNIGEGADRVGPDHRHPLVVRNLTVWHEHYSFRPECPAMIVENLRLHRSTYGFYHPNYDHHVYRNINVSHLGGFVFKRSNDAQGTPLGKNDIDFSTQYGPLTVDGVTFDACGQYSANTGVRAMIGLCDFNPTGAAVSHFRNVKVINAGGDKHRIMADRGPWPSPPARKNDKAVPVYFHDYYGPGRHAKVVNMAAEDFGADGLKYHEESPLTGFQSRVAEVGQLAFPELLNPVDDLPPATIITHVVPQKDGLLLVRGVTSDNGVVKKVVVNDQEARAVTPNYSEWEVVLKGQNAGNLKIQAHAVDAAGNVEQRPHVVSVNR